MPILEKETTFRCTEGFWMVQGHTCTELVPFLHLCASSLDTPVSQDQLQGRVNTPGGVGRTPFHHEHIMILFCCDVYLITYHQASWEVFSRVSNISLFFCHCFSLKPFCFLNGNIFNEVQWTYNKLHIFRFFTLINTDVGINIFTFEQNKALHVLTSFGVPSFSPFSSPHSPRLYLIYVRMLQINFHSLKTRKVDIYFVCFYFQAYLTQSLYLWILPCFCVNQQLLVLMKRVF